MRPDRGRVFRSGLGQDTFLLEPMPDAVVICDERGRIVFVNRRLEALTGFKRPLLIGQPLETLVPAPLRVAHRRNRLDYQARPRPRPMGSVDHDYVIRTAAGGQLAVDIAIGKVRRDGAPHFMAVIRDLTSRKRLEAQLVHEALHDPLTGLANRTLFFDRLQQAMAQAQRDRSRVALVLMDVDRFKTVNDIHGHQVGDAVLRRLAQKLGRGMRATDTFARIGGDEFALVLPNIKTAQAATTMMAKLQALVPRRLSIRGRSLEVAISAGLSIFPDDASDTDALIHIADIRLYANKRRSDRPER